MALLLVTLDDKGEVAGYSRITVWPDRSAAELAGAVRADLQNRGQGSAGMARAFGWIFEGLGVRMMCLTSALDNVRAQKGIDAAGFVRMGERDAVRPDGTIRRSVYWELTRDDWRLSTGCRRRRQASRSTKFPVVRIWALWARAAVSSLMEISASMRARGGRRISSSRFMPRSAITLARTSEGVLTSLFGGAMARRRTSARMRSAAVRTAWASPRARWATAKAVSRRIAPEWVTAVLMPRKARNPRRQRASTPPIAAAMVWGGKDLESYAGALAGWAPERGARFRSKNFGAIFGTASSRIDWTVQPSSLVTVSIGRGWE